ncbi:MULTISPECIES: lipopolysaccharide biosynthesis protein [Cupriavidus]
MNRIAPGRLASIFHVVWGQILLAFIAIAGIRLYTELLDTAEFGHVMLALGGYTLLDGLVVMAFSQTLALYCSRSKAPEARRSLAAGLYLECFRWWLLLSPVAVAGVALVCLVSGRGGVAAILLSLSTCLYLASETAKAAMTTLLNVESDHSRFSVWLVAEACVCFVAVTAALWFGPRNATTFIHAYVIAKIATTVFFHHRFYGGRFFLSVDRTILSACRAEAVRYGLPFSAMAVIGWLSSYADRYILNFAAAPATVGVYAAAAGTIGRPFAISGAILSNYFRPLLFRLTSEGRAAQASAVFRTWCAAAFLTGVAGMLGVHYLGPRLLPFLLAQPYREGAIEVMLVLSVGLSATIVCHSLDNLIFAGGTSHSLVMPQIGSVLVGMVAVVILAGLHGALGAAMGKVAGDVTKVVLTALLLAARRRRAGKAEACGVAP